MLQLGSHFLRNAAFLGRAVAAAYASGADRDALLAELDCEDVTEVVGAEPADSGLLFKSNGNAVLALRGSPAPVDPAGIAVWASNLDARKLPGAKGQVHRGFARAAAAWLENARPLLAGPLAGMPLFIAGHSRGAAMAALVARALANESPFRENPPTVHLLAPPRVGDAEFFQDWQRTPLTQTTYLWVNSGDPVPHMPSRRDFVHVETQWLLGPGAKQFEHGDIDDTGLADTFRFTLAQLLRLVAGTFSVRDLKTHALDSYLARIDRLI